MKQVDVIGNIGPGDAVVMPGPKVFNLTFHVEGDEWNSTTEVGTRARAIMLARDELIGVVGERSAAAGSVCIFDGDEALGAWDVEAGAEPLWEPAE